MPVTAQNKTEALLEIAGLAIAALEPENERLDLVRTLREIHCLANEFGHLEAEDGRG
jgi:hypothetical protein